MCRLVLAAILLLIQVTPAVPQENQTFRITCAGPQGARVQYSNNPAGPPEQYQKPIISDDSISGLKIEITFSTGQNAASLVSSGNKNIGGKVTSMNLIKIQSDDFISFVGTDPLDGSVNLFSYYPTMRRIIWSIQNNRISIIDDVAIGKIFMFEKCSEAKL